MKKPEGAEKDRESRREGRKETRQEFYKENQNKHMFFE